MSTKIEKIWGREVIDSRGYPALEVEIALASGISEYSSVPSGASKGLHEALEMRDGDANRYHGKGLQKSIQIIEKVIAPKVVGKMLNSIGDIDQVLKSIDSTNDKSLIGANTTLAISLAFSKCFAKAKKQWLFQVFTDEYRNRTSSKQSLENSKLRIPIPMLNVINGGQHANNNLILQEFMVVPVMHKDANINDRIRISCEFYHDLKVVIQDRKMSTNVGDEGGFAPDLENTEAVLDMLMGIIEKNVNYSENFKIAIDAAASTFFHDGKYQDSTDSKLQSASEMISLYKELVSKYPILSIEDPISENDIDGWKEITSALGNITLLVGDDLFVTNIDKLKHGINNKLGNAILIKPNQIGTITETIQAIHLAKQHGYEIIVSHRSGETEDIALAHFAVGVQASYIKAGAPCRSERTAKYNELMRIYEFLQNEN